MSHVTSDEAERIARAILGDPNSYEAKVAYVFMTSVILRLEQSMDQWPWPGETLMSTVAVREWLMACRATAAPRGAL